MDYTNTHLNISRAEDQLDTAVSDEVIECVVPLILIAGPTPPVLNLTPGFLMSSISAEQKELISQW